MTTNEQARKEFDKHCIENWRNLIGEFNQLWDDKAKDEKYITLRERAKNTSILTYRQRDAIIERCNNVILRCYGSTKTEEHLSHNKPSKKVA